MNNASISAQNLLNINALKLTNIVRTMDKMKN